MKKRLYLAICALCLASGAYADTLLSTDSSLKAIAQRQANPEMSTGHYPLNVATSKRAMVVSAHPLATQAGIEILRAGGTAADAAVAVEAVLGLVEPQSSGFGGGGFLVFAKQPNANESTQVISIDGREAAPSAATPARFLDADGRPLSFDAALANARAVGIPGEVAMLAEAHRQWGRLPWARLLQPAIRLAEMGAPVSHRLATLSANDHLLAASTSARSLFFDAQGKAWPAGTILRNPEYAKFLRVLAKKGPNAFYRGPLAQQMVAQLQQAGSDINLEDWQSYQARVSPALCRAVRKAETSVRICSSPPPAGGLSLIENIGLLQAAKVDDVADTSLHVMLEAERLSFADRQRYSADPLMAIVPVDGLLSPSYWQDRASLIGQRAAGVVTAGLPPGAPLAAVDTQTLERGTSHVSIVDKDGNWLAMTSSIEDAFGSRLLVKGVLMNNQLTDFSFVPVLDGLPVANRVEANKRPRSAMSPTLVLDSNDQPIMAVGTPGGSRILGFNTRVLSAWLGGEDDAGKLVSLPHALNRNGITEVEPNLSDDLLSDLKHRGHDVHEVEMTSGLGLILRHDKHLQGAADPRREGHAIGI